MSNEHDYVELRCRSAFSFLDGASSPEELVDAAAAGGHDTLALGDPRGVYGAPRFFAAARKAGIRPIVGAEVAFAADAHGHAPPPVLMLVEDRAGYQNLCRLLTRAWDGRRKDEGPVATHAMLAEHAAGLVALAGPEARADLPDLVAAFGRGNVFLEVQRHHDADEARRQRATIAQAGIAGVGLVATNDVRYATPDKRALHDVLTCARHRATVDDIGRRLPLNAERWLKPPKEMRALFRDLPSAVRASRAIAERCAFTLADLGYAFPTFPVAPGETEQSTLVALSEAGVRRLYDPGDPLLPKVRAQMRRELGIIERLGLAGYFLVVWDVVEFARGRGIMIQGRGSAANSAVCYLLGITAVDPVRMELLFERFLSEERAQSATNAADRMPDIDLDLPSGDRRESVIQHVYAKYGARGAAMTANVITYRPRMAVRDVGRALGLAEDQLGRITKHLPGSIVDPGTPLGAYIELAGFPRGDRRTRLLGELATSLLDLPRHLGQHSGGIVVAAGRLDEVVPLEPASMPGRVVVQWDKDDCADLGIVKVDLLGLGMLAAIEETIPMISTHEKIEVDLAHLPQDDPAVYAMLNAADTVGLFQVESRAQMASLPRNAPKCFYDIVVQVAIIRPGPIVGGMVRPFFERRQGRAPVEYADPCLEPILKRTLGVPLFQEQILKMAMVAAGFTGGEAEELRRAMGFKRSVERMDSIEARLRAGMAARGIGPAAQDQIVKCITSFALYGFPESHAASFALIAYASAYLKAHHPAAFLAALLNAWPMGFYHPATLVKDAQHHGTRVLPVDAARSGWTCRWEDGAVRLGMRFVKGLRREAGEAVERAQAERPFASVDDLARRTALKPGDLELLAHAGALAAFGKTRREALWQVAKASRRAGPLFASVPTDDPSPLPEMSPIEETRADYATTEMTAGPHMLAHLRAGLARRGVASAADLLRRGDGEVVTAAGAVIVRQRPGTAKGFVFLTLEDETGMLQAIVRPDLFKAQRAIVVGSGALVVEGRLQKQDGSMSVRAERFWTIPEFERMPSHDFR